MRHGYRSNNRTGGPRPAHRVHEVKPGHVIDQSGGRLRVLDEAGNVVDASRQVASWYVGGAGEVAQHASLTPVSVGQTLVGGITWTNESGAGYAYLCRFQGIPSSVIVAPNIPELTWVVQTLETYNCQVASDYPDTTTTKFTGIGVDVGSNAQPAAALAWAATEL